MGAILTFDTIRTSTMPEGTPFIGFRQGMKLPGRSRATLPDDAGDPQPVDMTGVDIKMTVEYYIARNLSVNREQVPAFSGETLNPEVPLRQLPDAAVVDATMGEYSFILDDDFYPTDINVPLNATQNVPFAAIQFTFEHNDWRLKEWLGVVIRRGLPTS